MLEFINRIRIKLVLCAILILLILIPSCITQAQYKWVLNGYVSLAAGADYFGSNYLMDDEFKAQKTISGWDGQAYEMPEIEIRNYVNALLAGDDTRAIPYNLTCEIKTYAANNALKTTDENMYKLKVELKDGNKEERVGTNITCNDSLAAGEGPRRNTYKMTIIPPSVLLEENEHVEITLKANNKTDKSSTDKRFDQSISVTFNYYVNMSNQFIREVTISKGRHGDFKMNIGTGTIPSIDFKTQTVVVWWDTTKIKIDPFNYGFLDSNWQCVEDPDTHIASLYMTDMGSNSYRQLDFFKLDTNINLDNIKDSVNVKPENASEDMYIGCYLLENKKS